ncbi:hypothetical protein BC938DRAFT_471516 [Jimgerdemannia flammicorona]|uniref:DUF4097 domain-containing protein n=1 Tax=Jimgerdemannia flammicorona TaxID=994334 RepID=A0A433Q7Z0_9FUNG|nr:hypothetical protein BC938DRAFT_471516 [Jimgerdemannia flammicorona]
MTFASPEYDPVLENDPTTPPPYPGYGTLPAPVVVKVYRRRLTACAIACRFFLFIFLLSSLSSLIALQISYGGGGLVDRDDPGHGHPVYLCRIGQGTLWEGSQNITSTVSEFTSLAVELQGTISKGHVSILHARNTNVTSAMIQMAVYYSQNINPSTISKHIVNDAGTYRHTLITPDQLKWSQCLTVRWIVVLPSAWADANALGVDVRNSHVEIAVEDLPFQEISIRTTNAWIEAKGLAAAAVHLESTNGKIHGQVSAGRELSVKTSNGLIDMTARNQSTETVSVHTTNGPVRGSYLAKRSVVLETTNGPVDAQTEAETVTVRSTNGAIRGSYHAVKALKIDTTNAPVEVEAKAEEVEVRTTNGKISGSYLSTLVMDARTTNGGILMEARGKEIMLKSTNGRIDGKFVVGSKIDVETSNNPINVDVSLLEEARFPTVKAVTSYGNSMVILPINFSGHFDVSTSYGQARVQNCLGDEYSCSQQDISFEKNTRTAKSGNKGNVNPRGQVVVMTRRSNAELFFV